jgi:hypothetical protein
VSVLNVALVVRMVNVKFQCLLYSYPYFFYQCFFFVVIRAVRGSSGSALGSRPGVLGSRDSALGSSGSVLWRRSAALGSK